METRNWASLGIVWFAEAVNEVFGENNQSDKRKVAIAQLPQIADLDKATKAGINILAWLNASNSIRVRAQAIARASMGELSIEALRERVFASLLGQRAVSGTRTVTVVHHTLPDGTLYDGNDEMDFRQLFALALVEMGVPGDIATEKAQKAVF